MKFVIIIIYAVVEFKFVFFFASFCISAHRHRSVRHSKSSSVVWILPWVYIYTIYIYDIGVTQAYMRRTFNQKTPGRRYMMQVLQESRIIVIIISRAHSYEHYSGFWILYKWFSFNSFSEFVSFWRDDFFDNIKT